jgi:hypothetical protein
VLVTFLSDFGLRDDFVGTCHGVIARIAPEVRIVDITHGIEPQQVLQGALVLANTLPYMPVGVHLAVVDPGVGSGRRALCLRGGDGRLYVGPDNGLLVPAVEKLGGVAAGWELTERRYMLERVSATFHGRDVFAPAAAHLARGVDPAELGPAADPATLVRLELPEPEVGSRRLRATVLYVDRYGNVQLNAKREHAERVGVEPGVRVELQLGSGRFFAVSARTFADARLGEIILYEDAYETLAVAISGGSAAQVLGSGPGDQVSITPA